MRQFFDRLSPLERRFLIAVLVVVFIVLNLAFVKPHFNDWSQVKQRLQDAHDTLAKFNTEIGKKDAITRKIATLENSGGTVPPEDQASQFMKAIQSQAALSHVTLLSTTPQQTSHTNKFFLEKVMAVSIQSDDKELVDFVYNLGSDSSMIRVRDLSLRPDTSRQNLSGTLRLVASYQKNTPGRPGTASIARSANPTP